MQTAWRAAYLDRRGWVGALNVLPASRQREVNEISPNGSQECVQR